MNQRGFLIILIGILLYSCNRDKYSRIENSEEISKSISKAKINTIEYEGKFIEIYKINDREYYLSLQNEHRSIDTFLTMMPIGENEIQYLKKDGNNIKLNYTNFYNSVRKKTEKVVKYMEPIYEFPK